MLSRVWRAFFQKAHLKWELAMQATEGGFFRCTLVFALVQAFYSFLRLVFLNDYLLFFPLSLVPPAAKEGKGDCEFPLCPPWILLLPLCNAGHFVPGGGYGGGLLSIELSISGGRFYGTAVDMVALLPCLDHAIALAGCGRLSFDCERGLTFLLNGLLPRFRSFAWPLWLWAQRCCVREPGS